MDSSKLCRSCMKEVATWERENFDFRAIEMFCFCTNIKIADNDKLPRQFCYDCIIKIESSFMYITEAQKVDAILRNIVSRTIAGIIVKSEIHTNLSTEIESPDHSLHSIGDDELDEKEIAEETRIKSENTEVVTEQTQKQFQKNDALSIMSNTSETEKDLPAEKKQQQEEKEMVNGEEIKKHVCSMCGKQYTSKFWYDKHVDSEHNGKKFACEHCTKLFSKRWELVQHSACHTKECKYSCPECGKGFKRRNQVKAHARAHIDRRPFECDKCGMKFKFKSVLKSHMKVHEGDKQYLCYFCGWSFAQAGNLSVHMRKHTGDKPYSCQECGFRSTVASSMKRHQRRHRRARTYVCKHCSKGFYDNSGLSRHIRTHTGELPYKCPGCARAFADSWKRKTHLMRAHRLDLNDIPPMRRDGTTKLLT